MKRKVLVAMAVCLSALGIGGCSMDMFESHSITLTTEYKGDTIDICPEITRDYLALENEEEIASYLGTYTGMKADYMNIAFSWAMDDSDVYTVHFSENKDFTDEVTFETESNKLTNQGIFVPGKTYYWKVTGDAPDSDSKVDKFKILDEPVRNITLEEGFNVRDIGGWKTEDGKKVRYGMIYRGGKINNRGGNEGLSEYDHYVFEDLLGIRGEIDLRITGQDDDKQTMSVFGNKVAYIKTPMHGYAHIIPGFLEEGELVRASNDEYVKSVGEVFHFLANADHYPVYFHCNAGADRTGTIAFMINGLLGVSEEDLTKDFELTSFSDGGKRWRSNIKDGKFTDDGVMQDDAMNYVAWGKMIKLLNEQYGVDGGTLSDTIENYLKTACGVTDAEIQAVKDLMLE